MSLYERMGLGIELDFRDNMSDRINPLIGDLDRLQRMAETTTSTMNRTNTMFGSFGRSINSRLFSDMRAGMQGLGSTANMVSRNLIQATASANAFARATNSLQTSGSFNRMYQDVLRTQQVLGRMGFGMSTLQEHARDAQVFNMMNYQLKDLQDRIKLTERGIREMMSSPNASQFTNEIALARRSLQTLQTELRAVNQQQTLLNAYGVKSGTFGGKNIMYHTAETNAQSIANRLLGLSYMDVARASMSAYQNIDKTGKMMVGAGYTTMELRQKLTALQMSLVMVGMGMSQWVTAPILVATAAIGAFARVFEQAESTFQARTLSTDFSMIGVDGYKQQLAEVWAQSGASYGDVANTMSNLANMFPKRNSSDIAGLSEIGLRYKKVWGVDAVQSIGEVDKIMKKYGVSSAQALDILTLGLKQTNGDLQASDKFINKNIGSLKKMTEAGNEGATAFERFAKYADDSPMQRLERGLKTLANTGRILWEAGIGEAIGKIGDALTKLGNGINTLLQANPLLAKFIGYSIAIAGGFFALLGPVALLTGGLIQFRNIALGTASAIFGLSKGGLAVLPPQAVMAREKVQALTVAMARLPQTLGAVGQILYSSLRMIPTFLMNIMKINPLIAIAGAGILAYANNWGGFHDTVNSYIDKMKGKWGELVQMYKDSSLPETFQKLGEYAKSFGQGFNEGLGVAVDLGRYFLDFVLTPIKEIFERLNPVVTSVANFISKVFGGDGDLKEGKETWEKIGKVVGAIVGSFFILRGVMSVTSFLVTPFQRMNTAIMGVGTSLDRLISRMAVLGGMGVNAVGNRLSAITSAPVNLARNTFGAVRNGISGASNFLFGRESNANAENGYSRGGLIPTASRFIFGSRGGNAVNGTQNIIRRTGTLLATPFTATRNALSPYFANMGLGSGVAMMQQRAQLRANGMALRNNPQLLASMRNAANGTLFGGRAGENMITATGLNQGTQVFQRQQSALSRALFGQRLDTYTPIYGPDGRLRGMERDNVGRTGGLLRRREMTAGSMAPNLLQRAWGTGTRFVGNGLNTLTNGATSMMLSRPRNTFDRFTNSRFARGFASTGNWMANRLQMANVANPFAGALRTTNITGGALTRRAMLGNFLRTTGGGFSSLAMGGLGMIGTGARRTVGAVRGTAGFVGRGIGTVASGVGMVGRGVGRTVRGAGRLATAPMRMLGGGLNRLMGMAPLLMAGGLLGSYAYNKLGKGKDGKTSVANISGNIDKLTANMGKGGSKGITQFWNNFKKYGSQILKSTGNLLVATFKALAPKIPGMLRDAWTGIRKLASVAFNWIKTDGVKMASAMGKGMRSLLSSAWNWIKTDGVKILGQVWTWLTNVGIPKAMSNAKKLLTSAYNWWKSDGQKIMGQLWTWFTSVAIPKMVSMAMKLLGKLWNWAKTDGVKLFGELIQWVLGTAIPNLVSTAMKLLGKLWKWFKDDGIKLLGSMAKDVGGAALKIGSALMKGILAGLKGIGKAILGLLPSMGDIKGKILGMFGGGGKDPKKHARGGIINSPHLGIVGEAGPEAIIPLSGNMRGIAGQLFKETAGILGYEISPKGNRNIPAYATGGIAGGNKPQSAPTPLATRGGKSNSSSQDNSVKIDKLEIHFSKTDSGVGEQSAKKQADLIMKELQKRVREGRLRKGNKFLSLEDVLLGN